MIGVLAGNGPKSKIYDSDFLTFQTNKTQDMIVFYPTNRYPDWNLDPKIGILMDDGGPFKTPVVPTIRNNIIRYAIDNGYEQLLIIDDDITGFNKYDAANMKDDEPLKYEKRAALPNFEEVYGGIIGANFKRFKLKTGKKYSNQIPYSCIYFNLKIYQERYGIVPTFETGVATWDDFDFALEMRKMGILPQTFNEYAIIKSGTQDSETVGKSIAAAGNDKASMLGYELYKKHGHANTLIKLKVNIIDVAPSMSKSYHPRFWTYRVDTYEHWKEDVLNNAHNIRKSEKAKNAGFHFGSN